MEFFEEIQREVLHNQKVLSESINQIGYGAYQKQLFLLCGMGKVTDFMYLKALSVMHIPIQNEFKLTNAGFGYIGACLSIGMLAGKSSFLIQALLSGDSQVTFMDASQHSIIP